MSPKIYRKSNPMYFILLNIKTKIVMLLCENIRKYLYVPRMAKIFLHTNSLRGNLIYGTHEIKSSPLQNTSFKKLKRQTIYRKKTPKIHFSEGLGWGQGGYGGYIVEEIYGEKKWDTCNICSIVNNKDKYF